MANATVIITAEEREFLKSLDKMESSEKSLEKSIDAVGRAGKRAGDETGESMERAGRKGITEFDQLLRELRKTGPEGRKQAQAIEKHLQETGKQGRQSVGTIVDRLGDIDPEIRKVAANAQTEFTKVESAGDAAFGAGALTKLTSLAGGVVSLGTAVELVNDYYADMVELMNEARDAQIELAASQSDAAKNLLGLSDLQRSTLLQDSVAEIARTTGFSDIGGLTAAIGSARSAGARDDQIVPAVMAAASITQLTPDAIDEYAAAGIDLSRATGVDDVGQNLSLLLSTVPQTRVVNPLDLAKELAPAVNNTVAQTFGQDRVEAAREAAALFSTFSKAATDTTGAPSRTATQDFSRALGDFYRGLDQQQVDARSRIQVLDSKKAPTEADNAERDRLTKFLAESQQVKDSGSLFGRITTLQQNEGLRDQFFSKEFGSGEFKVAFRELADASSLTTQTLLEAKAAIQADTAIFEAEARSQGSLTPQLKLGLMESQSAANLAIGQQGQTEAAQMSQIRKMVVETLRTTQTGGPGNWLDFQASTFGVNAFGTLKGQTPSEEAFSGLELFQQQAVRLQEGGLVGDEIASFRALMDQSRLLESVVSDGAQNLDGAQLQGLQRRIQIQTNQTARRIDQAGPSGLDPAVVEQLRRNNEVLLMLGEKLDQIAGSTNATAGNTSPAKRPPNYSAGLQAGADAAAMP